MGIVQGESNTPRLAAATLLAGVLIGALGALFLAALDFMEAARRALIDAASRLPFPGWLAAAGAGLVGASVAAWMARRYAPDAPQSSVAELAGASAGSTPDASAVAVNFSGASLAVGAGLALGPERPAIQIGGAVGHLVSRLLRLEPPDKDLILAATGSAGIATMFNAPLGCAAYTVEAVLKHVDLRIQLTALGAGAVAVGVARALLGRDVNFFVGTLPRVRFEHLIHFLLLGCLIAVVGNLQVRTIMSVVGLFERSRLSSMARSALIGFGVGVLAWWWPGFVGPGGALIQGVIDGRLLLPSLALGLLVRFLLGPVSIAAGTPGGYFTPVLLIGALCGAIYASLAARWLPAADLPPPAAFVLVGMAIALASVARAPFTGILLAMETTGTVALGLPMIIGVFGATAVVHALRSPSLGHGLELVRERRKEISRT
jgi:CIC family chloride channel protein